MQRMNVLSLKRMELLILVLNFLESYFVLGTVSLRYLYAAPSHLRQIEEYAMRALKHERLLLSKYAFVIRLFASLEHLLGVIDCGPVAEQRLSVHQLLLVQGFEELKVSVVLG